MTAIILGLTGAAALAQETNTVGPPALKDFQLPGQRTTPPAPQPQPLPKAEPPARPAPAPPAAAERPAARDARPRAAAPRAVRPVADGPLTADPAPAPAIVLPGAGETPPLPQTATPAPAPAPAPGWNPLWLALPALLALLGLGAFLRRRRLAAGPAARETLAVAPAPRPAPAAPAPAPDPAPVAADPRARLEIDFLPVRAAATDSEAAVHYDLVLRNAGEAPAGNIRIDTRMFNAGDERGIRAFLDGPIHDESGSPHVFVPPGGDMKLSSAIALPRAEVREIELQGRRVFVPVVAVNVAYDWAGGGRGRTSRSWLVGREPEQPAAKMGPFRLDLGPRVYRSVGRRPTRLANVA